LIPLQAASTQVPLAMPTTPAQTSQQLQLHDIHLPEQVSNLPTAVGWWLLTAIIIICALWLIRKLKTNRAINQSKNLALTVLKQQKTLSNIELISLLKWSAMQYFNRQHVASLYGDAFQRFLQQQLPEKHQQIFKHLTKQAFNEQYHAVSLTEHDDVNKATKNESNVNDDCKSAVKLWLTYALPPKDNTQKKDSQQNIATSKSPTEGVLAHD